MELLELEQRSEDFEYLIAAKVNSEVHENLLRGYIIFKCQKRANQAEAILNIEGRPERLEITIAKGSSRQHKAQVKCGHNFFEIGQNTFKGKEKSQLELMRDRRMHEATEDAMLEEFREALKDNKLKSRDSECSKNFKVRSCDHGRKLFFA